MSKSRKNKTRSARQKQLARQRAARDARLAVQQAADYPLYALRPPYSGYEHWLTPVADAPAATDLSDGAAAVHATIVSVAPLYQGKVPLAAVFLEQQIRRGVLHLAQPLGEVASVPLPDMATVLADTAAHFAAEPAPEDDTADVGRLLHELHALAALVVDDQHVIRLAALV
ncbi:hypothetical protein ACIQCF_33305 [Streptomyces sp. NPDC088353]|uniref:hypothetical protein n=1 Tax=Streptomyces sp. NPDC088353 TaxID=3365855 RepID=UPI00380C7A5D